MTRRLIPLIAALGLLVAACGDDDDTAASDTNDTDGVTQEDPDSEDGSEDAIDDAGGVAIQDFSFVPDSVEVSAGTSLTWTNEDGVTHTVTSGTDGQSDGTFDESVDSGSSVEIELAEPGTFSYYCAIHPSMTGEVVVS